MDVSKKVTDQSRCWELAASSSFCRRIYSEVEEIGWEHLVKLGEDLTFVSFRIIDSKGRAHILEISLDTTYPRYPPSVAAAIPYSFNLKWSPKSKLRDVVQQFHEHVDKLQDYWSTLDDIDQSLWVIDPENSHHAISHRQIKIGNGCSIILLLNASDPLSLPECRFLGPDTEVNSLRKTWNKNCKKWTKDKSFPENLALVFGNQLLQPPHAQENEEQVQCGICFAQHLTIDDELGGKSGSATDCTCENGNCNQTFHSICLGEWLLSIPKTRRSFDVLFGNCPYCSDPIAVRISTRNGALCCCLLCLSSCKSSCSNNGVSLLDLFLEVSLYPTVEFHIFCIQFHFNVTCIGIISLVLYISCIPHCQHSVSG